MAPEVTVIADSISPAGIRLTTLQLRYWRPVHAELMTHRVFSRNARSSRAVPNKVLLREPIIEPAKWGSNRPGMSAGDELTGWRRLLARIVWRLLARINRAGVRLLNFAGLHKQWSNRPLEWFGCIDVLVTATDFANWFALRLDAGAQPEIRDLAAAMKTAMDRSHPDPLRYGEWHLPYIRPLERGLLPLQTQIEVSVARCARLSYAPFDGHADIAAERARHDRLVISRPVHASPAEHQATPDSGEPAAWHAPRMHGNLRGWCQYRKSIVDEWVPG
ncbi:MAG: hypothetical protein AB7U38_13175 [Hyphomicrobiales bacterium]